MANTMLLAVFALLQVMCFLSTSPVHGVSAAAGSCHASGYVHGKETRCPKGSPDCCVVGKSYPRFRCSPPVSAKTPAILTLKVFDNGEDGGPTSCDMRFHRNTELVVALSSGWLRLDGGARRRCNGRIRVAAAANGRSVVARVVDECDSVNGCREEDGYSPPCGNNVVGGSPAVWKKLGLNESVGEFEVTWSDV